MRSDWLSNDASLASAPPVTAGETFPLLRLANVTVTRSDGGRTVTLLDKLSLRIAQGEHTVLLGPNGSGKTSLLKLLNRQFYPSIDDGQSGQVEILGRSTWHVDELRRQLGIVSGDLDREFALPRSGRMTALQAVLSGFDGVQLLSFTDQSDPMRLRRAAEALEQADAGPLADRSLMTLSTGERRRVLIARALVHRPHALILDEPTTGLDIAASGHFLDTIRGLARSGITIVLVTHHVEEIFPEIRSAVLLKGGRTFAVGPSVDLLRSDLVGQLFGVSIELGRSADGFYHWRRYDANS